MRIVNLEGESVEADRICAVRTIVDPPGPDYTIAAYLLDGRQVYCKEYDSGHPQELPEDFSTGGK